MQSNLPPMLRKAEVADFLRISARAVDGLLARGELTSIKLGTSRSSPVRVPREALLRFCGLAPSETEQRRRRRQRCIEARQAAAIERELAAAATGRPLMPAAAK